MCELNGTKCEPCEHKFVDFGVTEKNEPALLCLACMELVA